MNYEKITEVKINEIDFNNDLSYKHGWFYFVYSLDIRVNYEVTDVDTFVLMCEYFKRVIGNDFENYIKIWFIPNKGEYNYRIINDKVYQTENKKSLIILKSLFDEFTDADIEFIEIILDIIYESNGVLHAYDTEIHDHIGLLHLLVYISHHMNIGQGSKLFKMTDKKMTMLLNLLKFAS